MAVEVIYSLAAVCLAVDHKPGAFITASAALGKFLGFEKQPSQKGRIGGIQFHNIRNMSFRNNQEMNRRLGIHIMEGQEFLILVNFFGRDLPFCNFAENAVIHDIKVSLIPRIENDLYTILTIM